MHRSLRNRIDMEAWSLRLISQSLRTVLTGVKERRLQGGSTKDTPFTRLTGSHPLKIKI